MPVTPENLSIPRASLSSSANIEEAVNPALERIAAIMAPQDQGPWSTIPAATPERKGARYLVTAGQRQGTEYVCTGAEWLPVAAPAPIVTTLPTISDGSYEGHRVWLRASAAEQIYWDLRRVGANWVPSGRQVEQFSRFGSQTFDSASSTTTWTGVGPTLTVVAGGYYEIGWGATDAAVTGAATARLVPGVAGSPLWDPNHVDLDASISFAGTQVGAICGHARTSASLAAGVDVQSTCRLSVAGNAQLIGLWLSMTPIRLPAS